MNHEFYVRKHGRLAGVGYLTDMEFAALMYVAPAPRVPTSHKQTPLGSHHQGSAVVYPVSQYTTASPKSIAAELSNFDVIALNL